MARALALAGLLTLASATTTARRSCQAIGCPGYHRLVIPLVGRG